MINLRFTQILLQNNLDLATDRESELYACAGGAAQQVVDLLCQEEVPQRLPFSGFLNQTKPIHARYA